MLPAGLTALTDYALQATNYKGTSAAGSPHQTHPKTTTARADTTMVEQRRGLPKAAHSRAGKQRVPSYGSTENASVFRLFL
jgi:hypothetical protein